MKGQTWKNSIVCIFHPYGIDRSHRSNLANLRPVHLSYPKKQMRFAGAGLRPYRDFADYEALQLELTGSAFVGGFVVLQLAGGKLHSL